MYLRRMNPPKTTRSLVYRMQYWVGKDADNNDLPEEEQVALAAKKLLGSIWKDSTLIEDFSAAHVPEHIIMGPEGGSYRIKNAAGEIERCDKPDTGGF